MFTRLDDNGTHPPLTSHSRLVKNNLSVWTLSRPTVILAADEKNMEIKTLRLPFLLTGARLEAALESLTTRLNIWRSRQNPSSWLLSPVERALAIVGWGAWRLGKVARRGPKNVNELIKDVNIKDKLNKWERVNEATSAAALWNSSFNSKIASGWILSFLLIVNALYYEWQWKMISEFVFHLTETGLWTEDCGCCCCTGR